ncbi:MAG: 2-amino-4-hydroxy-6-hydroxymethyldihydropteridine diphosphokinase [Lachnospiraceae bacterium]|nr:2-amino-4-hydroxy-6-hydroxymethyldihydropteridine diphosphokinase [Lachnospiraceae bacterium]
MKYYDEIHIDNLEVFANHGVYPEENKLGQKFLVNAVLYTSTRKAGLTDDLNNSINYGTVCHMITAFLKDNTFKLIETLTEKLSEKLLNEIPHLEKITMEVRKPWAPVGLPLESVSVKISRSWHIAYLGLGSNIGDMGDYLDKAIDAVDELPSTKVLRSSSYIKTKPYGYLDQDDFLNSAIMIRTLYTPEELLDELHKIENANGRTREIHWGPRTLDIDILLYDELIMETDDLIIPHVEMHKRDFVLRPLVEIAPNLRHPVYRKTVSEMYDLLYREDVEL